MTDLRESTDLRFQGAACDGCGSIPPRGALDEDGWCDECRPRMRRRLRFWRHAVALLITVPFAVWVWRLDRGAYLPPVAWSLPLLAAYYLGLRIGGEVVKGYSRWRSAGRR